LFSFLQLNFSFFHNLSFDEVITNNIMEESRKKLEKKIESKNFILLI